jgi:phosphatidylglycerophosphate synthase
VTTPVPGQGRHLPGRDRYLQEWARLHGGYDPAAGSRLVRAWLGLTYRLGRPLAARGVPPDAVTAGGRWPLLAAVLAVAGGVLDNVDGCVAVLSGRVTAWGYVLDSVADRLCDGIYLVALWLLGAPGWVAAAAATAMVLLEYTRARAGAAGFTEIGVVTVGERPTRLIVTVVALAGAGIMPGDAWLAATIGAAATAAGCAVGFLQLAVVLRRALTPGRFTRGR